MPEALSILLPFLRGVLPVRAAVDAPLAAAVEEVAEEDGGVRVELALEEGVDALQVEVCVEDCEGGEGPGAAGVGVRVDELRVGYEGYVVGVRFFGLVSKC